MKKTLSLLIIASFLLTACQTVPENEKTNEDPKDSIVEMEQFGEYREDKISYTPSIQDYDVNVADDVKVAEAIYLNDNITEILDKYDFAVNPSETYSEFFEIYEDNRYNLVPNFITTDSLLHTYHLYFSYLLESLEKEKFIAMNKDISKKMFEHSLEKYEELKNTDLENAAKRNLEYFAVANKIIDESFEIPSSIQENVEIELSRIEQGKEIIQSTLFSRKEDYSQYKARGHYNKSEELKQYFKSMMWYGRLTFELEQEDETKSALLITSILNKDKALRDDWNTIYETINFFVGDPDDLSYVQYNEMAAEIYGSEITTQDLLENSNNQLEAFIAKAKNAKSPLINSIPVEETEDKNVSGFRFFGQRETVDASIFQKLVDDSVTDRMLPKTLDIAATFGMQDAYNQLKKEGDFDYENYKENFEKMKSFIDEQDLSYWGRNLYSAWMYSLKSFAQIYGEGYPQFMQNKQWKFKELLTFSASYTELKHDTILYAKQVYAEMGGGPFAEDADTRGYVEPNPELYNRVKSLIRLTIEGLANNDILTDKTKSELKKLEEIAERLRDISIKELENEELTAEDYEFIETYGGSLEHFWYETLSEDEKQQDTRALLNGHKEAIIADIATDPNGQVLEVGTGAISKAYFIYPAGDDYLLGSGGVYSFYEFTWPLENRLTDEEWREILFPYLFIDYSDPDYEEPSEDSFVPEIPSWQKDFTVENIW